MLIQSPKHLALHVVNQRKKLKLTQTEAGQRVGLKQKTISGFENRPEGSTLETLFLILSAVNLDIQVLPKNATADSQWKEEY
jgi:HTH-type transcriptional regulator/antitoxin HipB